MLASRLTSHHDPHLATGQCITFVFLHNGRFVASAKVFHMTGCAIDQHCLRTDHPSTCHLQNLVVHRQSGGMTQTGSPSWYALFLTSGGDGLWSMLFMRCSYWYMPFAGVLDGFSLSLGVALYQYTASAIEQRNFAFILLTVR